jgi:flagellar biosynthetic protein FlhB
MAEGEQSDDSQKTEEPSARKLEEARKKGQVPMSREVNTWLILLAATLLAGLYSTYMFSDFAALLKTYIEKADEFTVTTGGTSDVVGDAVKNALYLLAFPMILMIIASLAGPLLQVGLIFAPEVLKMDLNKVSPLSGFQRLFSMKAIVEFIKGLLKIGAVTVVGVVIFMPYLDQLDHMVGLPLPLLMQEIKALFMHLMIAVLIVMLVIAAIDLVYQRYEHYRKMRMTKQEVKDEFKQTEGDPKIKGRLRQLRMERARRRMMQNVPKADVVITNPTHFAIALEYKPDSMEAPICIAKGIDAVALRIREVAKEHDITIFENPPLARALYESVDLDETIPSEHYKAVAEVISFVFKRRGKL